MSLQCGRRCGWIVNVLFSPLPAIDKEDRLMDEWFDLIKQRDELNSREEEFVYM